MELQGKIISAIELSDSEKAKIAEKFEKLLNSKINFTFEVDSSLFGGFQAIINNTMYDLSVKSYLDRIKNYMDDDETAVNAESLQEAVNNISVDIDSVLEETKIGETLSERVETFHSDFDIAKIGVVERDGDGVVMVKGLEGCKNGELLQFEDGAYGIVMNLEQSRVGAVLLNGITNVTEGSLVRHTGEVVKVPVGDALLGRVVDPLGQPIDGKGKIITELSRPIEAPAPPIIDRQSVDEPLQTGIIAIDSMIPIGKGQRELIIGDRQTGKTAITVDTIINQRGKNVYCIYVAIAQKASTIADIVNKLEKFGAMEYTTVVASTPSDTAPMQYIAPYSGCAMAEEFMYNGKNVLIIYDDLSKHAVAYRTMSLLLRRPPGREAYPGDVFYLHSRLLERAGRLNDKLGGGSMTALPIIETMDGDISSYIPTNVISITDGQIYLETELFNSGQRPAINVGLSVSRVGGAAQIPAMRKVAGPLRIELAQYRELAVFAQFASDLDKTTQDAIANGQRLTQALIQPQYSTMSVEDQVVLLAMATNKVLMDIPVKLVHKFDNGFLDFEHAKRLDIFNQIKNEGSITQEQIDLIVQDAEEYKKTFLQENSKKDKELAI